jgi:hypothetical protein
MMDPDFDNARMINKRLEILLDAGKTTLPEMAPAGG